MYRHESLIIDNNKLKLFEELNNILKEQKSLDIASAHLSGTRSRDVASAIEIALFSTKL